ncbi:stage II sporulation protein M [Longimicrobium sp.]|uniref:stage II sporulation protein M n=1 Tax=Longimicrobium sp. TaxID=2029185 RepID=UPI002E313EDB|nr:stage II sporulation protein M [Longimicrobium sp.]HEX6037938.1 stage II sporulation protein M [Longimicrobium sp.]
MAHATAGHLLADRQVDVETPEHVAIGYELADLGSRFTAMLLDWLLIILAQLGIWLGLVALAALFGMENPVTGLGLGITIFASFVLVWGYFVFFEGLRDGQTPGKKWMGIRVVHDGGFPVTVRGAAVRNLLRVFIDFQPIPSWAIGGLSMMLHPQTKRIGDLVAGTVVVRDRTGQPIPEEAARTQAAPLGPPRMTDEEFAAVQMYAARRAALEGPVRAELSRKLLARVERHFPEDARRWQVSPDTFLAAVHDEELARRQAAGAGGRSGTAQATVLVRRQRAQWDEYQKLLDEARSKGLDQLGEAKVSRFAALYREMAADLARARTYGGSPELLYTMERMVGLGHNLLYRPPTRSWRRLWAFVTGGFAALVRRRWKVVALSSALFYLPAILSFAALRTSPDMAREILPPVLLDRAEDAAEKEARGEGYVEMPEVFMPAMATSLVANNVQVTFLAFAGGILAGLGTVYTLVMNGLLLGSVAGAFANEGQSLHLWTFVLGHGVIEITAICIAGGAGLWMGSALVLPGRMRRRDALVTRGREAVSLIGGTAVMLLIAGLIEGFISPSQLPREIKLMLAAIFAMACVSYFAFAGRSREDAEAAAAFAER